ncbi:MAG TPA: hypothetical protein VKA51_13260 [Rubrobacteraceae bacterium]|nr:hypothetical protein [Rubrobacteraceae bacterium]
MGKRFAILIGVAAAGVMALGAQTGAAASESVVKYDTRLTITTDRNIPHGRVHSEVRKCEFGRRVILFKKRPGPDRKLDTARMFGNVWWARQPKSDVVLRGLYAKVTRDVRDGFVCRADRSPTL